MQQMKLPKILTIAALIGATAMAGAAMADPQHGGYGPGSGMGPGMMGDYGPGGGYGPGYGMGPGGGYGPGAYGPGYGPGYGMGPGMMGPGMMGGYGPGYGMGPGMMGPGYGYGHHMGPGGGYGRGYGMGPGMMGGYGPGGYGMFGQLNLTSEQWSKINAIHDEFGKKQWELGGRMRDEAFKLRRLMTAEERDRNAINEQYKKLQDLRQQRFEARLDAREKIDGVLTDEQKQQLRRFSPWQ